MTKQIFFLHEMLAIAIVFLISFSATSLLDEYLGIAKHDSIPCSPSTQTKRQGDCYKSVSQPGLHSEFRGILRETK